MGKNLPNETNINAHFINANKIYQNGNRVVSNVNAPINKTDETIGLLYDSDFFNINGSNELSLNNSITLTNLQVNNSTITNLNINKGTFFNLIGTFTDSLFFSHDNQASHFLGNTLELLQSATIPNLITTLVNIEDPIYYNDGNLGIKIDNKTIDLNNNNEISIKDFNLSIPRPYFDGLFPRFHPIQIDKLSDVVDILDSFGLIPDISAFYASLGIDEDIAHIVETIGLNVYENQFEFKYAPSLPLEPFRTELKINLTNLPYTKGVLLFQDGDFTNIQNLQADFATNSVSIGNCYIEANDITTTNLICTDATFSNTLTVEGDTILADLECQHLACTSFFKNENFYYDNDTDFLLSNAVRILKTTPDVDSELICFEYLKNIEWLTDTNLGFGLEIVDGKLSGKAFFGINIDADGISVIPFNGITVDEDGVSVKPFFGINVDDDGVSVIPFNGITVDEDGVSVKPFFGINVDDDGVSVIPFNGITVDEDGVSAKPHFGITVNSDGISAKPYQGITVDNNGISVKNYDGIHIDSNGISVKAYQGIYVSSSGVSIDKGDGLEFSSSTLKVKAGSHITVDSSGVKCDLSAGTGLSLTGDSFSISNYTKYEGYNSTLTSHSGTLSTHTASIGALEASQGLQDISISGLVAGAVATGITLAVANANIDTLRNIVDNTTIAGAPETFLDTGHIRATTSNALIINNNITIPITDLLNTNLTSSNLLVSNSTLGNVIISNLTCSNVIFGNITTSNILFTSSTGTNLICTNNTLTNIYTDACTSNNLICTNNTLTNVYMDACTSNNLICTNSTQSNIKFTSSTGTNLLINNITAGNILGNNIGNDTSNYGTIHLNPASNPNCGYIAWHKSNGSTRLAYLGFGASDLNWAFEQTNGITFSFAGGDITMNSAGNLIVPNSATIGNIITDSIELDGSMELTGNITADGYIQSESIFCSTGLSSQPCIISEATHSSYTSTINHLVASREASDDFNFLQCDADTTTVFRVDGKGDVYTSGGIYAEDTSNFEYIYCIEGITTDGNVSAFGGVYAQYNSNIAVCQVVSTNATFTGDALKISTSKASNTDFNLIKAQSNGVVKFTVDGTGSTYNATGTYGTISDISVKENITPSRNYLEDLCKLRVVKYSLKSDNLDYADKIGFIAQEVEEVFPNLIETQKYEDEDIKIIKTSVLIPMLIKSVQELTDKVKVLEEKLGHK